MLPLSKLSSTSLSLAEFSEFCQFLFHKEQRATSAQICPTEQDDLFALSPALERAYQESRKDFNNTALAGTPIFLLEGNFRGSAYIKVEPNSENHLKNE